MQSVSYSSLSHEYKTLTAVLVDERDIGTELPLTTADFELQVRRLFCTRTSAALLRTYHQLPQRSVPVNPQDMSKGDLFINHSPEYTDSFLLLIKATMLFGRVTDYNVRSNLRAPAVVTRNQNPFFKPGFTELDKLVSTDFLESFPPSYKHLGLNEDGSMDTDLYLAHLLPHA